MSVRIARVPGRANLIGDHTDYNRGLALPIAVDRWCEVRAVPLGAREVRATSVELLGAVALRLDGPWEPSSVEPPWGRFVAGAVAALRAIGVEVDGAELTITSSVPIGAGLSSSSALAVALTRVLAPGLDLPLLARAELALDAEVRATRVPGGLMDQLVALAGRAHHALLVDFDTTAIEPVPIPHDVAVLVVFCGTTRTLAGSAYAARRAECEAVAASLGLRSLRDADAQQVAGSRRARHVVSENARVHDAVGALRAGDVASLGALMLASHASLRDDYEVSTPALNALVDALVRAGAAGARLTGAGFGGCVVAVTGAARAVEVLRDGCDAYRASTGIEPTGFVAQSVDGALVRAGNA